MAENPDEKRHRGRPRKPESGEASSEKEEPAFRPKVTKINAIAKRTVKTGQYEMYEISTMIEAEPDSAFSVSHNVSMINRLVTQEVTAMADEIRKSVEVDR
jgi:hypothetical protein